MRHKASEATCNIKSTLGLTMPNDVQCSAGFKKFCKGEPWEWGGRWSATRSWRRPTESSPLSWSSYKCARSCWRTQHRPLYGHSAFEASWRGDKAPLAGATWADRKSKQIIVSKNVVICYSTQEQQTISRLDCDVQWQVDFIQQLVTNSVVGPKRSSKALPKVKFARKKGHGLCLEVCCLSDQLQLSQSQRNHYIWEVCSADRWDALKTAASAARIGQRNGPSSPRQRPTACRTTNVSKVERIGLQSFALSAVFTWPPLANRLPLLQASCQLFAGKTVPQPAGGRKCFPRVHQILEHGYLCCRNKQTYFSLAKMCCCDDSSGE